MDANLILEFVQSFGHLLIDALMWAFDQNQSCLKVELSKDKRNIEQEKNIYEFSPERIIFGPESGRVEVTVKERH